MFYLPFEHPPKGSLEQPMTSLIQFPRKEQNSTTLSNCTARSLRENLLAPLLQVFDLRLSSRKSQFDLWEGLLCEDDCS